jgi:hypothetical protein
VQAIEAVIVVENRQMWLISSTYHWTFNKYFY